MTKRTGILPSDIDPAGNVTLWDHGPYEPKHSDAEVKAWHDANGAGPVAVVLHASDAGHAMMVEPDRYGLEPDEIDEGEVEKRMEEIRAKREAAARAPQDAIDRKTAIASIVSDRRAAELQAEPEPEAKTETIEEEEARRAAEEAERERLAKEDQI